MISFKGQKFLISGASSGIGWGITQLLNDLGAFVVLLGRDELVLQQKQQQLTHPDNTEYVVLDFTKERSIKTELIRSTENSGKFNGFVNAAGLDITKPLKLLSTSDFNKLYQLNITTPFSIVKDLIHKNVFHPDGGSILFINSVMASYGQKGKIAYSANKAAIKGLVLSLALELSTKKIRVNAISPGIVNTPLTEKLFTLLNDEAKSNIEKKHPLGFGKVSDVANLAAFLLSDKSTWITGVDYFIDGGYHISG